MRKLLLILGLMVSVGVSGQFINIPDTSFQKFLILKYPSCFNSLKQLDTICAAAQSDTSMYVYLFNNPMLDLTGLRYFTNLKSLIVEFSRVNTVPTFPPNLEYLEWIQNELTILPSLPNTLEELVCFGNSFTRLPKLPNGIKKINCTLNQIDSLPDFPNSLQEIDCSINSLVMLPTLLVGLKKLNCSGNFLTTLPSLPSSLISLNCATNNLSYLPTLSDSLATQGKRI